MLMHMRAKPAQDSDKNTSQKPVLADGLRRTRIRRGLTQSQLAGMVGIHRNSVQNLERGITRRVSPALAAALAKALNATIEALELRVRPPTPASILMRQLTPEERMVIEDLLNLEPEDFEFVRKTIANLRERNAQRTPPTGGRRPRR
jgi:transcriptional regulator with XRE-family HTH domain